MLGMLTRFAPRPGSKRRGARLGALSAHFEPGPEGPSRAGRGRRGHGGLLRELAHGDQHLPCVDLLPGHGVPARTSDFAGFLFRSVSALTRVSAPGREGLAHQDDQVLAERNASRRGAAGFGGPGPEVLQEDQVVQAIVPRAARLHSAPPPPPPPPPLGPGPRQGPVIGHGHVEEELQILGREIGPSSWGRPFYPSGPVRETASRPSGIELLCASLDLHRLAIVLVDDGITSAQGQPEA